MGDPATTKTSQPGPAARSHNNNNNNQEEKKQNGTQHQNAQTAIVLGRYLVNIIWTSTWTTYHRAPRESCSLVQSGLFYKLTQFVFYNQGYWVDWLLW